ncbi:MAG: hypothetical protein WC792_03495 [Candidatus Micrarchaeia archaeon]
MAPPHQRISVRQLRLAHGRVAEEIDDCAENGTAARKRLDAAHEDLGGKIEAYAKSRSVKRLAEIHDSAEIIRFMHPDLKWRDCAISRFLTLPLRKALSRTAKIRKIRARFKRIDLKNLHMRGEDADHLVRLLKTTGRNWKEYSGGAKIEKRGQRYVITPKYSNVGRQRMTVPFYYSAFFQSNSHAIWHTHPPESATPGLSEKDIEFSDKNRLPIMVAGIYKGRPFLNIYANGREENIKILPKR